MIDITTTIVVGAVVVAGPSDVPHPVMTTGQVEEEEVVVVTSVEVNHRIPVAAAGVVKDEEVEEVVASTEVVGVVPLTDVDRTGTAIVKLETRIVDR